MRSSAGVISNLTTSLKSGRKKQAGNQSGQITLKIPANMIKFKQRKAKTRPVTRDISPESPPVISLKSSKIARISYSKKDNLSK